MFYTFNSQKERRSFGGSCFLEFQFCRLPNGTDIKEILSVDNIRHWFDDSLYVQDDDAFYKEYSSIFDCGTYCNMECGVVDTYGINYYAPTLMDGIISKILNEKPTDYQNLAEWLEKAKKYNGFYILGI